MQNTAQASIWEADLYQPEMGATFCLPIRRIVSVKEVKVKPPMIAYHLIFSSADSDPAKGERSGKRKMLIEPPLLRSPRYGRQ